MGPDPSVLEGPCCCDDCFYTKACARRRLACQAFRDYVAGAGEEEWSVAERRPTRQAWEALFEPAASRARGLHGRKPRAETVVTATGAILLTARGVAAAFGVSRRTLATWVRHGAPRAVIGKATRTSLFSPSDVTAWLGSHRPSFASRPTRDSSAAPLTAEQRRERQRQSMQRIRDRRRAAARLSSSASA